MRTEIVLVTPKMAQGMLCHNHTNRAVRETQVARLAAVLVNGTWKLTHQGIAFDVDGRLVDGQHRLMAIVRAGIAAELMVSYDVSTEVFAVVDQGVKRNAADILGCGPRVAEVCNLAARIIMNASAPTPQALQAALTVVGPLAEEIQESCSTNAVYFSSAAMRLGAIVRMIAGEDKEFVLDLYGKLCRGDVSDLPPVGQALLKLRLRGKVTATDKYEALGHALYVFDKRNVNNKTMRSTEKNSAGDMVRLALRPQFDANFTAKPTTKLRQVA